MRWTAFGVSRPRSPTKSGHSAGGPSHPKGIGDVGTAFTWGSRLRSTAGTRWVGGQPPVAGRTISPSSGTSSSPRSAKLHAILRAVRVGSSTARSRGFEIRSRPVEKSTSPTSSVVSSPTFIPVSSRAYRMAWSRRQPRTSTCCRSRWTSPSASTRTTRSSRSPASDSKRSRAARPPPLLPPPSSPPLASDSHRP